MEIREVEKLIFTVARSSHKLSAEMSAVYGCPVIIFANGDYFVERNNRIEFYSFKGNSFSIDCE